MIVTHPAAELLDLSEMADSPPTKPQGDQPQPKPPVAEREPLVVTVVDAPAAEPATQLDIRVAEAAQPIDVQIEIPQPTEEAPRGPSYLSLAFGFGALLLFILYQLQFAPLVIRWEHGLQRRIFGQRTYYAHRKPHARGEAINQ